MKICLKRVNNMSSCKEFNLIICADECAGRRIRRNLPKCICGDGIKINIIVTGCDGVLVAPALPCNNVLAISSPIRVIRKNPCCEKKHESFCDDFDMRDFKFGMEEFNNNCSDNCNMMNSFVPETFAPEEFAIIVRSFSPAISKFLCEFPQMFITDCDNTVKLIIIFDKNGSVFQEQCVNNCGCGFGGGFGGGCGCGGGFSGGCGCGGGFGGGCGCGFGGLFGIAALALLFCC